MGDCNRFELGDLILTKDALYRLSYSSERKNGTITVPFLATRMGLEPSTSSVTG